MSESFNKGDLSEQDIITKYVLPAIERAGWDVALQVRQELSLTAGRIQVQGSVVSRDTPKRADIVLYRKPGIPLAVIEAKDNKHSVADGLQQALGYSEMLQVPFAFSTNGDAFEFHDQTLSSGQLQSTLNLDQFPSPDELWSHYCTHTGLDTAEKAQLCEQDYFDDASGKTPRYYQLNAINNTLEAIAKGNRRVLLVMATGTGKTFTAFQIIWRLWKARSVKRVLFLADRNILVDQTKTNDFKPFKGAMTKITKRTIDKSYEIYLALYQAISGTEETDNIYKEFSPDFFDLIVIDECHRGSAKEDSAWREILTHFDSAIHLGLTATPKETKYVSNIDYFKTPVYTYSLKEGIQDGFLAPYKVLRVDIDKDLQGWRPTAGQHDDHGNLIEDREYNQKDMDRNLVLEQRTKLVAQRVTDFLAKTDPYQKTIFFCEDIDHAERMRKALVNANPTYCAEDSKYVMQITGDNKVGKEHLDEFIHPAKKYPGLFIS